LGVSSNVTQFKDRHLPTERGELGEFALVREYHLKRK
jgi:hypothetical protein